MKSRLALLAALVVWAALHGLAHADIYMWTDPQTGQKRMSNLPPPWLGAPPTRRAPRVEVMRGNRVIDPLTALTTPQSPLPAAPAGSAPAAPKAEESSAVAGSGE